MKMIDLQYKMARDRDQSGDQSLRPPKRSNME